MATIKIAHSAIDENGKIFGGQAGDQNGKEVCIVPWWDKGWNVVIRFKDPAQREKFAAAMEAIAKNDNIGYAQDSRNTLLKEAEKVNWDIAKIKTPCECDCSSAVSVAAICAGISKTYMYPDGNCCTTRTLKSKLQATGKVEIFTDANHLRTDENALRGDIYLKEGSHVIAAIENGSAYVKPTPTVTNKVIGTAVANTTMTVRNAAKILGKAVGYIKKGEKVEVLEILSNGWYKIVYKKAACGYAYTSNANKKYYTYTPIKQTNTPIPSVPANNNFKVEILAYALYIRKGPGTINKAVGDLKRGTICTITEVKNNWGKLSDGRGWISLGSKYVKRL